MFPGTIFDGCEAYAQCARRAARPGGRQSLEADGSETAGEAFRARGQRISSDGEAGGSVCGEGRFHGHLWTGWCMSFASSLASPPRTLVATSAGRTGALSLEGKMVPAQGLEPRT